MKQTKKTVLKLYGNTDGITVHKITESYARSLKNHGWETIIAGYDKAKSEKKVTFEDLPYVSRYDHPLNKSVREIIKLTQKYKPDIIHAHTPYRELAALCAAKWTNTPAVTTYIGLHVTKKFSKSIPIMFCDKILQNLSGVIANSEWTKKYVIQTHKVPENKIHVIHQGINLDEFNPQNVSQERKDKIKKQWGINDDEIVLVMPARMDGWKGHEVVIEAAKIITQKYKNAKFIFPGTERESEQATKKKIQEKINQQNLNQNIFVPGPCKDIAAGYAVCDIVLNASTAPETFGYTIVEAQAMQKPIIATTIGATGENMKEEGKYPKGEMTGWRIEPNNPQKLAEVISRILKMDKRELDKITERGQKLVTQNFGEQKRADKLNKVYTKLIRA